MKELLSIMSGRRKFFSLLTIFLVAFSLVCSCGPDPEKEAKRRVTLDDAKNEPPLTEDEIFLFIRILPEYAEVEGKTEELNFFKKYNLTKNRFVFIRTKIDITLVTIAGGDKRLDMSRFPKSLYPPNQYELEIVTKHTEDLRDAGAKYIKAIQK